MRRIALLALALAASTALAASPATAQPYRRAHRYDDAPNQLRLRLGIFTPEGDSEYWQDKERDFTGAPDDFEDGILSGDYLYRLAPHLDLMVSASAYAGQQDQEYRDFVDDRGDPIVHTTELEITSFTLGLRARLLPEGAVIVPYVGVGGGAYLWRLGETGDFIDFAPADPEIFFADFAAEGTALGWYALAGLDVPLGSSVSLFAEGRWHQADDELGDDFRGFGDLDLSGTEVDAGVAWRF